MVDGRSLTLPNCSDQPRRDSIRLSPMFGLCRVASWSSLERTIMPDSSRVTSGWVVSRRGRSKLASRSLLWWCSRLRKFRTTIAVDQNQSYLHTSIAWHREADLLKCQYLALWSLREIKNMGHYMESWHIQYSSNTQCMHLWFLQQSNETYRGASCWVDK